MSLELFCSNIAFPFCTVVALDKIKYDAKSTEIGGLLINNPVLLSFIIIEILMICRAIYLTNHSYLNEGRKQVAFIFYIYIGILLIDLILISQLIFSLHSIFHFLLTTIEIALINTLYMALALSIIFIRRTDISLIQNISLVYFTVSAVFYLLFLNEETILIALSLLFIGNLVLLSIFIFGVIYCLYKLNADFWAYGAFLCGMFSYLISTIFIFQFSHIVFAFSNSYLDNLFIYHVLIFFAALLFHKLWDSLSSRENECMSLRREEILMYKKYK